jgi:hypothetical protein
MKGAIGSPNQPFKSYVLETHEGASHTGKRTRQPLLISLSGC